MPIVAVEEPLREKLGSEAVASLIRLINQSQSEQKRDTLEIVEEKFERRLSEEIGKLDIKISETKADLMTQISQTRADLIKWMFIFWIGQVGVILGILFAFFKS
jgi:CHASE3 domain sensor protein